MGHSYANILIHAVFSTKDRHPWRSTEIRDDHLHMLFVHPRTLSMSTLMEKAKANSSGWIKRRWRVRSGFGWQTGYAPFSVSKPHLEAAPRYIRNQEEHHRLISFQEELLRFLDRQGIEYDPRYVFA